MVEVRDLGLGGVLELRPTRHEDPRGLFCETWSADGYRQAGIDVAFVQDNHSISRAANVLRGLHFQTAPMAQAKLVRVTRGAVFDVAVDLRAGSPTYGRWTSVRLAASDWNQMFIPTGFAHGFLTLEPDCEVQYKVSAPYSAEHDRAIAFDDPDLAIDWPGTPADFIMSEKDRAAPTLAEYVNTVRG